MTTKTAFHELASIESQSKLVPDGLASSYPFYLRLSSYDGFPVLVVELGDTLYLYVEEPGYARYVYDTFKADSPLHSLIVWIGRCLDKR